MQLFTHETAKYTGIDSCSSEATSLSVREKLDRYGVDGLSDHELLILMLDGKKTRISTASLASATLAVIDALTPNAIYRSLKSVKAVGSEKAAMLSASHEFARRRIQPHPTKVRGPEDIAQLLSYLNTREQEHFISISLNGAYEVKQVRVLTIGLLTLSVLKKQRFFRTFRLYVRVSQIQTSPTELL